MAVRRENNPRQMNLQPELQDILRRNGMQAFVAETETGYQLVVQGHDSPMLAYNINQAQLSALIDWGTNYANRKAYNTFAQIVKADFDMPRDFVHARNANGRVAMGLHGYRIGCGEYGRPMTPGYDRMGWHCHGPHGPMPFLGWTPREQPGWHLRRIGGNVYYAGAPMVPERPDGRMKPGELQNGGYGFYWKGSYGGNQGYVPPQQDPLADLSNLVELTAANRPQEPAKKYSEVITSDVYFSTDKWLEVLQSHGIVIDTDNKTLTIQSSAVPVDLQYDLTDEELASLTNNSLAEVCLDKRLEILNNVIKDDFADPITKDMLNSDKIIGIKMHPEQMQEIEQQLQPDPEVSVTPLQGRVRDLCLPEDNREGVVTMDGYDLYLMDESKGWYREGKHGREVAVDGIRVTPKDENGKYHMTAVIDGQVITKEISEKDYNKFLMLDDYHRFKLFAKIFHEVDIKNNPDYQRSNGDGISTGTKVGLGILAGLTVAGEVMHGLHGGPRGPRPAPEFYGGGPYFKPGVDSPAEISHRAFEAGMNTEHMRHDLGHGR